MNISFNIQMSNFQVNSKTERHKWEMLFCKGPPDARFSWISGFSYGLGPSFEAFRRTAAQKQMVQSTVLRPYLSGGPKGWNSAFDETHDFHNLFQTFGHTLDSYPWLIHLSFNRMITCFKYLVSNPKVDNKRETAKVKNLFWQCSSNWVFSWNSGFSCGLAP